MERLELDATLAINRLKHESRSILMAIHEAGGVGVERKDLYNLVKYSPRSIGARLRHMEGLELVYVSKLLCLTDKGQAAVDVVLQWRAEEKAEADEEKRRMDAGREEFFSKYPERVQAIKELVARSKARVLKQRALEEQLHALKEEQHKDELALEDQVYEFTTRKSTASDELSHYAYRVQDAEFKVGKWPEFKAEGPKS